MDSRRAARRLRIWTAGVALIATAAALIAATPVAAAPAAAASAAPPLPDGWTLTSTGDGARLTWRAAEAVPMGDAAVRFHAGDRLLGTARPAPDGRTFTLDVTGPLGAPSDLQVRAAGRRLDAPATAARRSGQAPRTDWRPGPPAPVDPGRPGRYATTTGEYTLPGVRLPEFPEPVEMRGVVVAPVGARGSRPLVLFLHGRHSICYGGDDEQAWPCPPGTRPLPSHRGYLAAQRLLASQGYVTVSIAANGINGQDFVADDGGAQARSSLVRLHLTQWSRWAGRGRAQAPPIVRTAPRADLSQVLLVGHSRGGEGVNRAAIDSLVRPPAAADGHHLPVRWRIRGTLQIAPTIFGHNPVADVPSVVLLPGCDGDVFDLQGQVTVDGTRGVSRTPALHSALFVVGANHNYFNTEWTPGQAVAPAWDDWSDDGDAVCGPGAPTSLRLTPRQQQQVGATYVAAAARLFVADDDRVLQLLDGSGAVAPSAAPARVLSHAVGAARVPLVEPTTRPVRATGTGTTKARVCLQAPRYGDPKACLVDEISPHFVPYFGVPSEPHRRAVALSWSGAGAAATLRPDRPVSLAGARSVALRLILPPNTPPTGFDVRIADTSGRRATLGRVTLAGLPGSGQTVDLWGQEARVPLRVRGLDLRRIARLELVPRSGSGRAWLVDAWGQRPGTPAVRPAPVIRVDAAGGPLTVRETDADQLVRVPVSVTGRGSGLVRFYAYSWQTGDQSVSVVRLRPGTRAVAIPVGGDDAFGYSTSYQVFAQAVNGAVVGDYNRDVVVEEDDPAPTMTVTPLDDDVTEGGTLSWRVTLSKPVSQPVYPFITFLPPASGRELSTTDLPADWVANNLFVDAEPSRPLSAADALFSAEIGAGVTQAVVTMPTRTDALTEGAETVRMRLEPLGDPPPPTLPELTGIVRDA